MKASFAFGGGMALGAYHGGVVEASSRAGIAPVAIAGTSVGAIACAVLAGNPADARLNRFKQLWGYREEAATPRLSSAPAWLFAVRARLVGEQGQFHPRNPLENMSVFRSVYDLSPLQARLAELVDFDRLNGGDIRVCIAATDVQSGDPVLFDTAKGERITVDHVMASCGFLPEFAPLDINGRLLGDGGLSLNVPFDPLLEGAAGDHPLFLADLFARDGPRPDSLAAAAERKSDLTFANQTFLRLQACLRDPQLASLSVSLLSYREKVPEAGTEKPYDYSSTAIAQRWHAGLSDMMAAIQQYELSGGAAGLRVIRR